MGSDAGTGTCFCRVLSQQGWIFGRRRTSFPMRLLPPLVWSFEIKDLGTAVARSLRNKDLQVKYLNINNLAPVFDRFFC